MLAACGGPESKAATEPGVPVVPVVPGVPGSAASGASDGGIESSAAEAHRRADAALQALVAHFWDPQGAFTMAPDGSAAAHYWIAAQALDAVLDGVERSGGRHWAELPGVFVRAQEVRGWRRNFFDDEAWMAIALLRAYDLTGDTLAKDRAEALVQDIESSAPDATCCGSQPGGLWWDRQHTQKATAANAGTVIAAVRLFARGGDVRHLDFARKVFADWSAQMVDPASGQVADHVLPSGEKVWWRFSYNEGTMIGAALELHRATGDAAYLDSARRIGAFLAAKETVSSAAGAVLSDGPGCTGDCDQFKGIAQRYLAALAVADPAGGWGALVQTNAEAIWSLARDPDRDLFGVDWAGLGGSAGSVGSVNLASQSSAAMALSVAAEAAGPYPE